MIFSDYPKTFLMIVLFTISTMFLSKAESKENKGNKENWTYCYNSSSNRIYFLEMRELKKSGKCHGRTYFQGKKKYHLIQDTVDEKGFSRNEPGISMKVNIDKNRSVLVTQWNNLTKRNIVIVLEPDYRNKRVKKHCSFKNFSDEYKIKMKKKSGKFMINVNEPVTELSEKFHRVWKLCSSL